MAEDRKEPAPHVEAAVPVTAVADSMGFSFQVHTKARVHPVYSKDCCCTTQATGVHQHVHRTGRPGDTLKSVWSPEYEIGIFPKNPVTPTAQSKHKELYVPWP